MKISQKLTLGFTSVALLAAVVGYISVNTSKKALKENIGQTSTALANKILEHIDRCIYQRIEISQEYCHHFEVQRIISESNRKFEKLDNIQNYIDEQDHRWTSVPKEEVTPFMRQLMDNEFSEALRETLEFYKEKYGYKAFGEAFVTNKYGANVAQTGKTSDYYQADEKWWQEAKKDGLYVGDVEYDKSADVYGTDIGIRIDDVNGYFLGIMKVVLNIEEGINIINEAKNSAKYKTTQFKIVNKNGKIIYSTKTETEPFENIPEVLLPIHTEKHYYGYFTAEDKEEERLFTYARSKGYKDFKGLGWILVVEHTTEEIFAPVTKLRNFIAIISLVITMLAVLLGLLISKTIAGSVSRLAAAAAKIGAGNLHTKVNIKSNDEIGQLAATFNKMTEDLSKTTTSIEKLNREIAERKKREKELKETHERLIEASHRAGMAEVATDVLHNVGNVLNSINVSTNFIQGKVLNSKVKNLKKVTDIMAEHADDLATFFAEDQRAKYIPVYLTEATRLITDEHADITEKLRSLNKNVGHLKEIVRTQQTYAKAGGVRIFTDISEIIKDAIQVNKAGLDRHGVKFNLELTELPRICIDKQRVLQILVNLISNGKYALARSKNQEKLLTVRCRKHGEDRLQIEVVDNGVGIPQENLSKIFRHGFTTKKDGHGFGLHSSALAAKEIHGSLTVQSDGFEQGATFILELPFETKGAAQCVL